MGNPYNSQSISGYNATPPPDDASQTAANQVSWAKHKTKLGDPVKTLSEGINTEVLAAFGKLPWYTTRSISTSDSVVALDERKLLSCTNTITITLLAAGTAGNGFTTTVFNAGTGTITIDGDAAETINGALTFTLTGQYDSVHLFCDGSSWFAVAEKKEITVALPRGHLAALTLSNGTDATNDIDITDGACRSDADDANIIIPSAVGKQLDGSWVAGGTPGTPTGGLSSSLTLTNDTWYHAIAGLVSGTAEIGFDTSITGANLVTDHSFTNTRRIGSVRRLTAANKLFTQIGDRVLWTTPVLEISAQAMSTGSQTLRTLMCPLGVRTEVEFNYMTSVISGSGTALYFRTPDTTDSAPSDTVAPLHSNDYSRGNAATTASSGGDARVITNTSSQIAERSSQAGNISIATISYVDRRGRDG